MNLIEFLELFNDSVIICHPYSLRKGSPMKHYVSIEEAMEANKKGMDVYFIPNSGGVKASEVHTINACFVDLDAGKEEGKYLSLEAVELKKKRMLESIKQFPLSPTVIVETRNGFQVYWLLNNRKEVAVPDWILIQRKLMTFFNGVGSDKSIIKPNQLMRLPYTEWIKGWTGLPKFSTRIIESEDRQYSIIELQQALDKITPYSNSAEDSKINSRPISTYNIDLIKTKDVDRLRGKMLMALKQVILMISDNQENNHTKYYNKKLLISCMVSISNHGKPLIIRSREELFDIFSMLPLDIFLGLPINTKFRCVFHNDKTPSANVWISEDSKYLYKCFGSSCGFCGDMIKVVSRIQDTDVSGAIEFIKSVFNIKLETEWQNDTKAKLQDYINYLSSTSFSTDYPTLYSFIKPHIRKLIAVLKVAYQNVLDKNVFQYDKQVFYVSTRHLARVMSKDGIKGVSDPTTLNAKMLLFVHLGLIERVEEDILPNRLKKHLYELVTQNAADGEKIDYKNHISVYAIPAFTEKLFCEAEAKAKEFRELGMKKTGYSRNMVISTLGKEQADKIYVQNTDKTISKSVQDFYVKYKAQAQLLINKQGYFSESQLLDKMKGYSSYKKSFRSRELLPRLRKELGLRATTVNKRTREEYSVDRKIVSRSIIFVPNNA